METGEGLTQSPRVVSDTTQEFLGVRYYRCGFYFQRKGSRLHRAVWVSNRGPIPKGYHVHHKDGDRSNNAFDNLELLAASVHLSGHSKLTGRISSEARSAAASWHRSEEGRAWHSRHYRAVIQPKMAERIALSCQHCGQAFEARRIFVRQSKFCTPACKARALRKRRAIARETRRLLPID